jgi:hypothetical protein
LVVEVVALVAIAAVVETEPAVETLAVGLAVGSVVGSAVVEYSQVEDRAVLVGQVEVEDQVQSYSEAVAISHQNYEADLIVGSLLLLRISTPAPIPFRYRRVRHARLTMKLLR